MSGTNPSTAYNIIITVTLIQSHWQGTSSVNVLESTPTAVNGVLTVCAGQQISLTCSHDNVATASTLWIVSPPVNCMTAVSHTILTADPQCVPFMFQGITRLEVGITLLNSTTVATATANMTGTNIECRGGNVINSFSVGNISLSVISVVGELCMHEVKQLQCCPITLENENKNIETQTMVYRHDYSTYTYC